MGDRFAELHNRMLLRIHDTINQAEKDIAAYEAYCEVVKRRGDRHGVMDAEAEMRELEAQVKVLKELLQ